MIMAKLVIVDDEPNVLNALRRLCLNHDAPPAISNPQLMSFTSPVKALEYLEDHPVDLIISDYRMPEMDGATFLTETQKLQANSARIIIGTHADIEGIMHAINVAGIFQFVSKPWSDRELKGAIVQVLAHRALLIENQLLANEVRRQRDIISEHQAELERLELESPGITHVR
jgi:response regulator RpfG family c-di-GMP phosphodiesterase